MPGSKTATLIQASSLLCPVFVPARSPEIEGFFDACKMIVPQGRTSKILQPGHPI